MVEREPQDRRERKRILRTLIVAGPILSGLAVLGCKASEVEITPTQTATETPILNESPFGFTIPEEYLQSWDKALEYVRQLENQKGDELVDNSEIRISTSVGSIPEKKPPQMLVDVKQPMDASEAKALQEKWTQNLRILFDPLDICQIDIGWGVTTRPDINPGSQDPLGDLGLNPEEFQKTPGC